MIYEYLDALYAKTILHSISSESTKEDPGNWVHQVIEELEKKQITLPER